MSDSSPLLSAKQSSSDYILSCNVYFAASAENRCECYACNCDDCDGDGASSLHAGFCVIGTLCFAGL